MTLLYAFIFSGVVCLIGQLIYDNTKLTPGHITSIFVILGVLLFTSGIYGKLLEIFSGGAFISIMNFGYLLTKGAMEGAINNGFIGIFQGMFSSGGATLSFVIAVATLFSIVCKPHP